MVDSAKLTVKTLQISVYRRLVAYGCNRKRGVTVTFVKFVHARNLRRLLSTSRPDYLLTQQ